MKSKYCESLMLKLNTKYENGKISHIYCPVRHRMIDVVSKPEEFVRQALLVWINEELASYNLKIDLEFQHIDIALRLYSDLENFQPLIPPVVIFETKAKDISLWTNSIEYQIEKYLDKSEGRLGIGFNCQNILMIKRGENFRKKMLTSFNKLKDEILAERTLFDLSKDEEYFKLACKGDYNSFKKLSQKYRESHFEIDTKKGRITCFLFDELKNEDLKYCHVYSYKKTKSKLRKSDFIKLMSIKKE